QQRILRVLARPVVQDNVQIVQRLSRVAGTVVTHPADVTRVFFLTGFWKFIKIRVDRFHGRSIFSPSKQGTGGLERQVILLRGTEITDIGVGRVADIARSISLIEVDVFDKT